MHERIDNIFGRQEREDGAAAPSDREIAAAVGYADPAGLYKRFRAAFGMTPGEYRLSFE